MKRASLSAPLGPDFAADFVLDMNYFDLCGGTRRQPQLLFMRTFKPILQPGYDFVRDPLEFHRLQGTQSPLEATQEAVAKLSLNVDRWQSQASKKLDTLEEKVDIGICRMEDQSRGNVVAAAKAARLPVPFSSGETCEAFLDNEEYEVALLTIMEYNEDLVNEKMRGESLNKKELEISVLLHYLFTTDALMNMAADDVGPATLHLLEDRSRWLLGERACVSRKAVITSIKRHLYYVHVTKVKRG